MDRATRIIVENLRSENVRLHTCCDIIEDRVRKEVHEWYSIRIAPLEDWARKQPSEEVKRAVFGCMANATPTVYDSPTHAQILNSYKHALEKAEREIAALKAELAATDSQHGQPAMQVPCKHAVCDIKTDFYQCSAGCQLYEPAPAQQA